LEEFAFKAGLFSVLQLAMEAEGGGCVGASTTNR
jgi:hypothetical protein